MSAKTFRGRRLRARTRLAHRRRGHAADCAGRESSIFSNGIIQDFYRPENEAIWSAVRSLSDHQKPCDVHAVRAYLQERGQISTNSHGLTGSYLIDLVSAPTVVDPAYVAEIIRERAQRRRVIELHQRGLQRAYESADDAETQLRATEEELGRLLRGPSQKVEEAYEFRPGGSFILDTDPTPRALWGDGEQVLWADGEALIIAGAQGLGKTTLAQQLALGWIGFEGYGELLDMPITPGMRLLYLAMDRPRQAARSFRRMVTDDQRGELNDRLLVWAGPPPQDLARYPSLLLKLCDQAMADAVIVDSLKDAAIPLSDDDVGADYNRARQMACVNGVQVAELHHVRKQQTSKKAEAELTIDDLYGSTWLTSGAGSVLLLTGKPGDPIVKMRHLKQPSAEVGPYTVLHNDVTGRSTIWHAMDLLEHVRACGPVTAFATAEQLFDTASPTAAEREKPRRRLDRLVASGHLLVLDRATPRPTDPPPGRRRSDLHAPPRDAPSADLHKPSTTSTAHAQQTSTQTSTASTRPRPPRHGGVLIEPPW